MRECLELLSQELRQNALNPGPFSVHGLSLRGGQVVYSWDAAFMKHTDKAKNECIILTNVTDDTDPSPLLIVYSDQDCSNPENRDFYRRVMIEKVRACLLCDLHANPVGTTYRITSDELLTRTTDDVFNYLGKSRQQGLRQLVREYILKRVANIWSDRQVGVTVNVDELSIRWQLSGQKQDFLDWLEDRQTAFDATKLTDDAQMLIDTTDQSTKN